MYPGTRMKFLDRLFGKRASALASVPAGHSRVQTAERQFKNDFGLALYGLLRQRQGNLFFSPFSIRAALGMACAGARGETAGQMRQVLGFAVSDETLHAAVAAVVERLNATGAGQYEMAVANALWSQSGESLQAEFLDLVERYYAGGVNPVDFRRDPASARALINHWVEDRTRRRIRELIPRDGIGPDTRLVLANAVYFKGLWELQFHKTATRDEPFYLEDGTEVSAPLMHRKVLVRHVQAGGYQAVDLDYRGGDLSMLVLLPDRKARLRDLEATISVGMLENCIAQLHWREVELSIPRFKMTWDAELASQLQGLGMPLAFSRAQADFSGINGHPPPDEDSFFISAVFHKAFVEVNEEGTEAAAATAVVMELAAALERSTPPPIPVFRADHSFLFAIRDRKSDAILFLGRMADPTRET